MGEFNVKIKVNGEEYRKNVEPTMRLIDFLRDVLSLTGTKEGCGKGECGSCTVIMDGYTVNSCLVLVAQANGGEIITIEGLGDKENMHPLQEAFIRHGAVQCGYCTPGLILSAKYLLDHNPHPTETDIRKGIAGNLCRCTGYKKVVTAIKSVAEGRGAK